MFPSTGNIADEVRKPYQDYLTKTDVGIVKMYQRMNTALPARRNQTEPCVHFEVLFYVFEMYVAYGIVWKGDVYCPKKRLTLKKRVNHYEIAHKVSAKVLLTGGRHPLNDGVFRLQG